MENRLIQFELSIPKFFIYYCNYYSHVLCYNDSIFGNDIFHIYFEDLLLSVIDCQII